jgi:hypothetical protein
VSRLREFDQGDEDTDAEEQSQDDVDPERLPEDELVEELDDGEECGGDAPQPLANLGTPGEMQIGEEGDDADAEIVDGVAVAKLHYVLASVGA